MNAICQVSATVSRRQFPVNAELTLTPGSVHALVGPNGAGKTTVAELIAGRLVPDFGRISFGETPLTLVAKGARRPSILVPPATRSVGYLEQHPKLFPHLNVQSNVAFGMRAKGISAAAAHALASDWLKRIGIEDYARARPKELSGGQRQRVALVRTLATMPNILVLDEPFAALASDSLPSVRDLVSSFLKDAGIPTLLITHSLVDAWVLADTLTVMEHGAMVETGPTAELLTQPTHPFTARLSGLNTQPIGGGDDPQLVAFSPANVRLALLTADPASLAPMVQGDMAWKGTVHSLDQSAAGITARVAIDSAFTVPDVVVDLPFNELAASGVTQGARVLCKVGIDHRTIYSAQR